jgi:tetratricopeptide (TPR) repeat protein
VIGKRIGGIRITQLLGEGGMGSVYAGFDEKLRREVALKVIRSDRLSPTAKARFLREAQILSQLDHPNICAIHNYIDGEDGDFLVLEMVKGRDLRDVVAEGITREDRLKIAEQVASALVAAHGKGIVHRDLKLSNLMITRENGIKVLDFGLAKSEGALATLAGTPIEGLPLQSLWEDEAERQEVYAGALSAPARTQAGSVVGTLSSMSPEQARGEKVTTASDMFSFGLLLRELFTGCPAYDEHLPIPLLLEKVQRGDTLPVTRLEPDLAELIERLLSYVPEARPAAAEALDRLRWIREKPRRRVRQLAAGFLALLLVGAGVLHTLELRRERNAAHQARRESEQAHVEAERARREAEEVSNFLVGLFAVSDPTAHRGGDITARELLERGAGSIQSELRDQPLHRARLMDTIGWIYYRLGLYKEARPLLEEGLALRRRELGQDHPDVASSLRNLALLGTDAGVDTQPLFQRALDIQVESLGPDHPEVATTLNAFATLYGRRADYQRAGPMLERALAIREKTLGRMHPDLALTLNNLAFVKIAQGDLRQGEALLRRGLAIREKTLPPDHPDLAANLEGLAVLYSEQGRYLQALSLHRRALAISEKRLGPRHPKVALILSNLANDHARLGRSREAEELYRRVITLRESTLGAGHPDCAPPLAGLADVYLSEERYTEAEALYRRALVLLEQHGLLVTETASRAKAQLARIELLTGEPPPAP